MTHNVDGNRMHYITTYQSVTGILHMINKSPLDWYSKKQGALETATYVSEFVAAHICVVQIIDLCNILCYLDNNIWDKSYMFWDNKYIVDSYIQVHAKLHKSHKYLHSTECVKQYPPEWLESISFQVVWILLISVAGTGASPRSALSLRPFYFGKVMTLNNRGAILRTNSDY